MVNSEDVETLVDDVLGDPSINIKSMPDYLERQIYRFTIQLTLNALYKALGGLHGREILGHELQVSRVSRQLDNIHGDLLRIGEDTSLHEDVLEAVADRLLENKNVNLQMVPDILERQIYANCLKIVFRVLDLLAASFKLTLCGHDIRLPLQPVL